MFAAIYISVAGTNTRSRKGFSSEEEVEDYLITQLCESCNELRELELQGILYDDDYPTSSWKSCLCEWDVMEEDDVNPEFLNSIKDWKCL